MRLGSAFFVTVALLSLSGCSETREFFGLNSKPPDEFAVVDHPPLSIPPDFDLRPPRPGATAVQGGNAGEKAAKALYGDGNMELVTQKGVNSLNLQGMSGAEQALIMQSGSDKADPAIRHTLDREGQQVVGDRKLVDRLLFWKETKPKETGTALDAAAERKRLEAVKQRGLPVNSGGTPAYDTSGRTVIP